MNLLKIINRDKEICELKSFIEEQTGYAPGLGFWDGETVEEYRVRLRQIAEEIRKKKKDQEDK